MTQPTKAAKRSFWTSYEGWKQLGWSPGVIPRPVFELPMRDGNWSSGQWRCVLAAFLNFLWGMETAFNLTDPTPPLQFLNFLWGMETLTPRILLAPVQLFLNFLWGMETIFRRWITAAFPGFWTSYEGWKLVPPTFFTKSVSSFLNFLWGMETNLGTLHKGGSLPFLNFLWGMETFLKFAIVKQTFSGFWTSYEGWKLFLSRVRCS